jgi:hypothetical protein
MNVTVILIRPYMLIQSYVALKALEHNAWHLNRNTGTVMTYTDRANA